MNESINKKAFIFNLDWKETRTKWSKWVGCMYQLWWNESMCSFNKQRMCYRSKKIQFTLILLMAWKFTIVKSNFDVISLIQQPCFVQVRKKEPPHPIRVAKTIDVIARITFPSAFAVFLIFFFIHYKGFS